jgi:hypothetical protein
MAAAERGHAQIVDLLIRAGASVTLTDETGQTALTRAQKVLMNQQGIVSQPPPRLGRDEK